MAKGDSSRVQNAIDYQGGTAQNVLNNQITRSNQLYGGMLKNYNTGVDMNLPDYSNVMQSYKDFLSGGSPGSNSGKATPGATSLDTLNMGNLSDPSTWMSLVGNEQQRTAFAKQILGPGASDELVNYYAGKIKEQPGANPTEQAGSAQYWMDKMLKDPMFGGSSGNQPAGAVQGWQNMAATGGFTPQDIQDLRARAVAPVRAAYQTAQDNISRQRALSGGYSPGYTAAQAKMARDKAYGMSDAETSANAGIAGMKQSGMISGLQGLTGAQLGALGGMTGMYGTTPALSSTFGNQVLQSSGQNLQAAQLQKQLMDSIISGQLGRAGLPSRWDQLGSAAKGIGGMAGTIGTIAGAL